MANGNGRRRTDVRTLSFPLQIVVLIVSSSVAAAGSIWVSQAGMRSDVRDINTRLELTAAATADKAALEKRLEEERAKNVEEKFAALKSSIDRLIAEIRMTQENVQNMRVADAQQRK